MNPKLTTMSRAGKRCLRSRAHPTGLPGLEDDADERVRADNALLEGCLDVLGEALVAKVPAVLTLPRGGFHLQQPSLEGFLEKHPGSRLGDADLGAYGCAWKGAIVFIGNSGSCLPELKLVPSGAKLLDGRQAALDGSRWQGSGADWPSSFLEEWASSVSSSVDRGEPVPEEEESSEEFGLRKLARERAPAIGANWTNPKRWRVVIRGRWKRQEHNNVLEGRAALQSLRRLSRSSRNWGTRVLMLGDSQVIQGCFSKGRSSCYPLLLLGRRLASLLLATRMRLGIRYVNTKVNPSDAPSRGSLFPGVA
jgi:hypothetical protein